MLLRRGRIGEGKKHFGQKSLLRPNSRNSRNSRTVIHLAWRVSVDGRGRGGKGAVRRKGRERENREEPRMKG